MMYMLRFMEKKASVGRLVLYGDEKEPWIALDYYQVFEEGEDGLISGITIRHIPDT